jgi:dGTPase
MFVPKWEFILIYNSMGFQLLSFIFVQNDDRMDWMQLLSISRYGSTREELNSDAIRSSFEKDSDRIIFSEGFRRLQNKTQVIPLPEDAFVHNRLTHSLEVSSVGRSLGKQVGEWLLTNRAELKERGYHAADFGTIVASASLAHDIGNPPFGHAGEKAISEYFLHGKGQQFKAKLSEAQWNDLSNFEGNAHGFRLLNHSHSGIEGGIRLTYATLAAFMKYPKPSHPIIANPGASQKKYGFFQSEKELFKEVAQETGLLLRDEKASSWARHPLAFLVEAADDICYTVIDFEDAYGMKIISFETIEALFIPLAGEFFNSARYRKIAFESQKVKYLRAIAISNLVLSLSKVFIQNEEAILDGSYDRPLMKDSSLTSLVSEIIGISVEKIYGSKSVLAMETAGFEILNGLMETYVEAINNVFEGRGSYAAKTIVKQLPEECFNHDAEIDSDLYTRLLKVTSYVASMTDSQAIKQFRQLKGIELPKH